MSCRQSKGFSLAGAGGRDPVRGGFALAELLLALCCVAVVLVPFLLYLRQAGLLQHEGSERGRVLSWGAYQRQVLGQGIDPTQARHFQEQHPLVAGRLVESVSRVDAGLGGAAGRLVLLASREQASGAERMLGGAGFEVRAGEPGTPVVVPEQPSQVFTMQPPVFAPVNGASLVPVQLAGGILLVRAGSNEGGRVVVELRRPGRQGQGLGLAQILVTAEELAQGLEGEAWVEYPGVEGRAQQAVQTEDGRTLWYVESAGVVSRHMPSARVPLRYTLELGRPVLVLGGTDYESGQIVPVDFRLVSAVREGRAAVRIQWPDTIRALFSGGWVEAGEFDLRFQSLPGDNSSLGNLMFGTEALGNWTARSVLVADARLPVGCRAQEGRWTLERQPLELPQPERVQGGVMVSQPELPGRFDFQVGTMENLGRPGRLSARAGSVLGAGGSLSLEVLP